MNEQIEQESLAIAEMVKAIIKKYNLPADDVYELAGDVYEQNMILTPVDNFPKTK